jgi:dTDP-4-dehydrorhamnose 3,5-epimerase-like enzyme
MEVADADIADVKFIKPVCHRDARGLLSEICREDVLNDHGIH